MALTKILQIFMGRKYIPGALRTLNSRMSRLTQVTMQELVSMETIGSANSSSLRNVIKSVRTGYFLICGITK